MFYAYHTCIQLKYAVIGKHQRNTFSIQYLCLIAVHAHVQCSFSGCTEHQASSAGWGLITEQLHNSCSVTGRKRKSLVLKSSISITRTLIFPSLSTGAILELLQVSRVTQKISKLSIRGVQTRISLALPLLQFLTPVLHYTLPSGVRISPSFFECLPQLVTSECRSWIFYTVLQAAAYHSIAFSLSASLYSSCSMYARGCVRIYLFNTQPPCKD